MSDNLLKGLSRSNYVRRPKVPMKALLCNTHYFYIVDGDVSQQHTKHIVAGPSQQWLRECATGYFIRTLPMFFVLNYYYYYYLHYHARTSVIKGARGGAVG